MDARLHQITKALRRNMPRNTDVVELCDKAERMERELIASAQAGKVQDQIAPLPKSRSKQPVQMSGADAQAMLESLRKEYPELFAPLTNGGKGATVRTIDERVDDCPVCTARKKKDAKRKKRKRVVATIPGQR